MTNHDTAETVAETVADALMRLPRRERIDAATVLAIGSDAEVAELVARLTT